MKESPSPGKCSYTSQESLCFTRGGVCAACDIDKTFLDLAVQEEAPTAEQLAELRERLNSLPEDSRWWSGSIGQKVLAEAARFIAGGKARCRVSYTLQRA